jgi:hypothetical protein
MCMGLFTLLLFFGGTLLWRGYKLHKRTMRILGVPRSKLMSAPQGLIEVEGFAWPKAEVAVPRSSGGEPCVYRQIEVQKFQMSKWMIVQRFKKWITIHVHTDAPPFYVVDPTGVAEVRAETSEQEIEHQRTHYLHLTWGRRRQELLSQLPAHVRASMGLSVFRLHRIVEKSILVGSPLIVSGEFRTSQVEEIVEPSLAAFRDRVMSQSTAAKKIKNLSGQLDTNGDGKVSSKEARQGYSELAQVVMRGTKTDAQPVALFGTFESSTNHMLMIADQHEAHLTARMKMSRNLHVFVGAAVIMFSLSLMEGEFRFKSNPSNRLHKTVLQQHDQCFNGNRSACRYLVESAEKYRLTPEYVAIYRAKGCERGLAELCDRRNPAGMNPLKK